MDEIEYADKNWTSLGNVNGKTVGVQVVYTTTPDKTRKLEFYVDVSALDKDVDDLQTPPNQWKLFFTAEDDGEWDNGGEPYLENQGEANDDDSLGLYFRINTEKDTAFKWVGAIELE